MKPEYRELRLAQLDRQLSLLGQVQALSKPQNGWLRAVREALGTTIRQVAHTLHKTPQTVASFEKSEAADRITLQTLRQYADALDCQLVYAIVPKTGSLKTLAEAKTRRNVEKDVLAVEHSMALENQATSGIQDKINKETKRLLKKR